MSAQTGIEWTDATWNPTVGCSIISPGCTNCYAMKVANGLERRFDSPKYRGLTKVVNGNAVWTGEVRLDEAALLQPLKWKRGRRIFVNSMSDLFHESLNDAHIDRVFAVMALCPQHTFQVLTKRAERMREYVSNAQHRVVTRTAGGSPNVSVHAAKSYHSRTHVGGEQQWPLPNVWLGVSAERQEEADERIPHLLSTPAAIRFVSLEPLLGPIDLSAIPLDGAVRSDRPVFDRPLLHWVIVGGESGAKARPMSIQWARELREQCKFAGGVPFFFKQWGEWRPAGSQPSGAPGRFAFGDYEHDRKAMMQVDGYPRQFTKFGARSTLERVGKKAAGRLLDGREHSEFPKLPHTQGDLLCG